MKRVCPLVAIACSSALIIVPRAFAMPVPMPPPTDEDTEVADERDEDSAAAREPEPEPAPEVTESESKPAPAEDAPPPRVSEGIGPDEVKLHSGGLVIGVVTEVEPRSHVTIIVGGSGEVRRIPWADVELVERGKHAPPAVDPRTEPAPGRPRVHLQVEGRGEVKLYEVTRDDGGGGTRPEPTDLERCTAPCDVVVDGTAGQQFVLGGKGISRSLSFSLIDAEPDTTITVKPGRRGLFIAGWTLAAIGAGAVIGGAVALTFADDDKTRRRGGGITFLGGLPLVAGGGVMIAFGRTRFRIGEAPSRRRNAEP